MQITQLHYSNTNTYLIESGETSLLFDTGWAGTFLAFCKELGEHGKKLQDIDYILISHFHPDHMGIVGEIATYGPVPVIMDVQMPYVHASDEILKRDAHVAFFPVKEHESKIVGITESREFLKSIGFAGEILHTPGHSDDSISLYLDEGSVFVGDLNPLYELELHKGTQIEESWNTILLKKPKYVYYGHAKAANLSNSGEAAEKAPVYEKDMYALVEKIMKYADKGVSKEKVAKKTGADVAFIEEVNRMYLTHRNVGVAGILDRIELKGMEKGV